MSEHVVELKDVTKRFPGVVALKNMSLSVKPGEILGLIGENGAGKSTLIKVLTGVYQAEEGQVYVNGAKQHFRNPNDSAAAGVACVYQELNIEKLLTVTDNIFINKWLRKKSGLLDYAAMNKRAKEVMESLGIDIDPSKTAGSFGMGVQQMIEIAKAILIDAKMIIMDEPTSSLGEKEVELLMRICRNLKSRGISIIFVSHKLEELFELCDRVTVMRDGEHIWTKPVSETDNDDLITAMVGRSMDKLFVKDKTEQGACALKAVNIKECGVLHDVSFSAYNGQILGFAGLVGAGRTELMRAVFGADPIDGGQIYLHGKAVKIKNMNLFVCGLLFMMILILAMVGHISFDLMKSYFEFKDYSIFYIENITDIDDEIIKRAKESNKNPDELARYYENRFKEDMIKLNVDSVNLYPRVIYHLNEIFNQIQTLIDKGFGYETETGVYY